MKRKLTAILLIITGVALLLAALLLRFHNRTEAIQASNAASASLEALEAIITETQTEAENAVVTDGAGYSEDSDLLLPYQTSEGKAVQQESVITVDDVAYLGYLSIPSLDITVPVSSVCSYELLSRTACRQCGTADGNDLVVAAHNYVAHFGEIRNLTGGEEVSFTQVDGQTVRYRVVCTDILSPEEVDAVVNSDYDLVFYTCTYGGVSRVIVYCNRQ